MIKLSFSTSPKFCLQDLIWLQCTQKLSFRQQGPHQTHGDLTLISPEDFYGVLREIFEHNCVPGAVLEIKEWVATLNERKSGWQTALWSNICPVVRHTWPTTDNREQFLIGNDTSTDTQGHFSRPHVLSELSTVSHTLTHIEESCNPIEGSSLPENKMPYTVKWQHTEGLGVCPTLRTP